MAGGPITVTDRISVRVSAKTQEQSAANKKAVGGAIGKTLGNEDISDELKTQLGNTKNPVVYDEDGNAWISMEDIIAAGRKMKEEGALEDKTIYKYGNVSAVLVKSLQEVEIGLYSYNWGLETYPDHDRNPHAYGPLFRTAEGVYRFDRPYGDNATVGIVHNVHENTYSMLYNNLGGGIALYGGTGPNDSDWVFPMYGYVSAPELDATCEMFIPVTDVGETLLSLSAYGDETEETVAGSLIDWDASDAEVERQINELHETWDVSEHEGAVTANGTYILAGPIEFNDGD